MDGCSFGFGSNGSSSGGTVTAANDGLSLSSTTVQLGQAVGAGGNPAALLQAREIPFSNFKLSFLGNSGSDSIVFDNTSTLFQQIELDGLGTTQTDGLVLTNKTAAAAGAQQVSPSLILEGQGWKTNATAASQSVRFREYILPVQGTAAPTARLYWGLSINGGAYTDLMSLQSNGLQITQAGLSLGGAIPVANTITIGSTLTFRPAGAPSLNLFTFAGGNNTATSGENTLAIFTNGSDSFAPVSGSGNYNGITSAPVINQMGTASGTTRGLYVNPTLTSAVNFLAIETVVGDLLLGSTSGKVGIGLTATASLTIRAGTTAAGTAPLKLTSGVSLTTPEPGAIEYDGTNAYLTDGTSTRYTIAKILTASAVLDFPSTPANSQRSDYNSNRRSRGRSCGIGK